MTVKLARILRINREVSRALFTLFSLDLDARKVQELYNRYARFEALKKAALELDKMASASKNPFIRSEAKEKEDDEPSTGNESDVVETPLPINKKQAKKPKKLPKSSAQVEDSSENEEETQSDKDFIDNKDVSLDSEGQAELEAIKRSLGSAKHVSPKKKRRVERVLETPEEDGDTTDENEAPPPPKKPAPKRKLAIDGKEKKKPLPNKRRKREVEEVVEEHDEVENSFSDSGVNMDASYAELGLDEGDMSALFNEDGEEEDGGEPELHLTPRQIVEGKRCPFCFGELNIGVSKKPPHKPYCLCGPGTCQWTYVPPNKQAEFMVIAATTVQPEFQYPNQKPTCNHGLPMTAHWVWDTNGFDEKDAKILKNCIFFQCPIGPKDEEKRVPCDAVKLANQGDAKKIPAFERIYKNAVIKMKVARRKIQNQHAYSAGHHLFKIQGNKGFLAKFGVKF